MKVFILGVLFFSMLTVYADDNREDIESLLNLRKGVKSILAEMKKDTELFPTTSVPKKLLSREQRVKCWDIYQLFMDNMIALEKHRQRFENAKDALEGRGKKKMRRLEYAAFLMKYRYAMEFIILCDNNPVLDGVLNEKVPETGLPADSYKELKNRYLNPVIAAHFVKGNTYFRVRKYQLDTTIDKNIKSDESRIWDFGKGAGPLKTVSNAANLIKKKSFSAWFPIQKEVSEWMGDTKVWRLKTSLVTEEQIADVRKKLQPGDVLFGRHEWFLSNLGLPGFWPHAALYIGKPEDRNSFFAGDKEVEAYALKMSEGKTNDFEKLLQFLNKDAYAQSLVKDKHKKQPEVIEAISEGVSFTSLDLCLEVDSAAGLRPKLSKLEVAKAIVKAFNLSGRPYDFDFDFQTDAEIVCTELVYKSYEKSETTKGLTFPISKILGKYVVPANKMIVMFDEQYDTEQKQLDFVFFLDGNEKKRIAESKDAKALCGSHTRPKWHVFYSN